MRTTALLLTLLLLTPLASHAQAAGDPDLSFQHEIQRSINKGLSWLEKNQDPGGYWLNPDFPAVTALALLAQQSNPGAPKAQPAWAKAGYAFLLKNVQKDGSIHAGKGLANYNTAIAMMALLAANDPQYTPAIKNARAYLVKEQWDLDKKGETDNPLDGGIGYGKTYPHSDLNNTLTALEAIYYSRHLIADSPDTKDLNWAAAIQFIQNCQNLPSHNKLPWASAEASQKGGFIYFPGHSMAGEVVDSKSGRKSLRSYGSISYAGLLSYSYAQLKKDDPRIQAVTKWLGDNYTLEENPGVGAQGIYYYYYLMAKALSIQGTDDVVLASGKKVNWRRELSMQLMKLQKDDGSWQNENPRWMEKEKALVTAYSIIALNYIHRGRGVGR